MRLPRLRISLFRMLVVITVACVMLAIVSRIRSREIAQRKTIADLCGYVEFFPSSNSSVFSRGLDLSFNRGPDLGKSKAATIIYDFQLEEHLAGQSTGLMWIAEPSWLADQLGRDWVHSVALVNFAVPATPREIQIANRFDRLQVIELDDGLQNQEAWNELTKAKSPRKLEICVYRSDVSEDFDAEIDQTLVVRRDRIKQPPIEFVGLSKMTGLTELAVKNGRLTLFNLRQIAVTKNIQTLRLLDVQITPPDLLEFPRLETIKSLYWSTYINPLNDAEFRFIENLPNLENLALSGSFELTDQVFSSLEKLSHLKQLSLHGTKLTGTELKRVSHLNLDKLELAASSLNDAGLAGIEDFQQLTHLEIGSTRVTDAGMESVSRLPLLRYLSIRDTAIGDAGLMQLSKLKQLKLLQIRDTAITAAGLAEFRKRSACLIDRN